MSDGGKTIFIIDDDRFLLDMYSLKFKQQGYLVESSASGQEALAKLRGGLIPTVMLLDIVMPGLDGIEFIDTLKKENLAANAVIIVLSNQGEEEDIERAKEHGAHEYIVKANSIPSDVLEKVNTVIAKYAAK
jgi:CheY-like chemotaxis protein